jgi:membrane dipeptidase
MEIMEMAENPVIFSHSNPYGMWEHYRNVQDEAIRACAGTGGVVAITGMGDFLGDNDRFAESMVRHVDYIVQLVGPDHVGIGTDYVFDNQELIDYVTNNPETFDPARYSDGFPMMAPEQIPRMTELLSNMNYSDQDVRNILGGNHLRVASQVWK